MCSTSTPNGHAESVSFRSQGTWRRIPKAASWPALLFADPPSAYALLAWDGDQLVGMAAYSFMWPAAGVTTSLYLKELYVAADRRGSGVGRAVMTELVRIAAERACSRVEWTADADNPDAQRFYERLGYSPATSKIFYRAALPPE